MKERISIIFFTRQGYALACRMREALDAEEIQIYTTKEEIASEHPEVLLVSGGLQTWCAAVFYSSRLLIFIGASGIAVRTIAPFLQSKTKDPAVLVADERGNYVISLLSGHLGGANAYARQVALSIGAEPVITTASDVNRKLAIDVWADKNHLTIADLGAAKRIAADLVDGKTVLFYCGGEVSGQIPDELVRVRMPAKKELSLDVSGGRTLLSNRLIYVSPFTYTGFEQPDGKTPKQTGKILHLIPRAVILGIGCKRGKTFEEIHAFLTRLLKEHQIMEKSIAAVVSIDRKADEAGLQQLADFLQCPFLTFPAESLMEIPGEFTGSEFVKKTIGVDNVCERAALAALAPEERAAAGFICRKQAENGVTAALLEKNWRVCFE